MTKSNVGKISYSNRYKDIKTLENYCDRGNDAWRDSLVAGNGENGVIESCGPATDIMIFQNMKFGYPTNAIRVTPCMSTEREAIAKSIVNYNGNYLSREGGQRASDLMLEAATQWVKAMNFSDKWDLQNTYAFHPAYQLRIQKENDENGTEKRYERYTNYQSGEIGTNWTDKNNCSWERKTFTSREDNVNITSVKSKSGEKINLTISIDDIARMSNEGAGETKLEELRYRKIADVENGAYIGISAHYPYYKNSEFNSAGFGGVTMVFIKGGQREYVFGSSEADDYKNPIGGATEREMNIGYDKKPSIKVTNADEAYFITKTDIDTKMCTLGEFEDSDICPRYIDDIIEDIVKVWEKYGGENFDYDSALSLSKKKHGEIFNRITYSACVEKEDIEMRSYTNEALIESQRESKKNILPAMAERLFYNGRFACVCASGIQAPRLGGMWTGAWGCEWSGDYTTDANINLQIAGANIGSLWEETEGFINVMLKGVVDWELNAKQVYGIDDALLAPSRTDGYTAVLTHFSSFFPGQMWISGAAWLIEPMYEYYKCFGNRKIPITKDIRAMLEFTGNKYEGYREVVDKYGTRADWHDFNIRRSKSGERIIYNLRNTLMLTDERADEILRTGYFDFKSDILYPLVKKCANFYLGFVDERYYTKDKKAYYDENHLVMQRDEGWLFAPSYSPENQPENTNNSYTANSTMDISASRSIMKMAEELEEELGGEEKDENISRYRYYLKHLPPYVYEESGELKEWALSGYAERYSHRHGSQLYGLWPAFEASGDEKLFSGAKKLIKTKNSIDYGDSKSGHGWLHRSLVMARLKDGEGVKNTLLPLISNNMIYTSMMMAHNNDGTAAYCTDPVITIPAIIIESLVYTDADTIMLLPAVIPELKKGGKIGGISLRCGGRLLNMEWTQNCVKAEIENSKGVRLKCGIGFSSLILNGVDITKNTVVDENGERSFSIETEDKIEVEIIF
jgi:hypothetical protein